MAAPSAITISLTNSNTTACSLTGATATIPQGATDSTGFDGQVTATTTPGSCSIAGTATGGFSGYPTAATVSTNALGGISLPAEVLAPPAPAAGVSFTVTLTSPAPAGGATVSLSTTDSTIATVTPSVSFAQGATTAQATLTGGNAGSTSITATSTNYGSTSTLATVEVVTMDFTDLNGNSLYGQLNWAMGTNAQAEIKLSAAAPATGLTITLNAGLSQTGGQVATVSASVFVPAGQLISNPFTAVSVAQGTATMTASNASVTTGSLTLSVGAPQQITVSDAGNGVLGAGLHRNFQVSLNWAAPAGGLPVTISGFSGSLSTVPTTTVTVAAGYTSASFEVDGLAPGSDSLTASASGWASGTAAYSVVDPTVLFYFQPTASITTATASNSFSIYLNTPGCGQCDLANAAEAVNYSFASNTTGAPAPSAGTFTAGTNYLTGAVGQPSTAGTYQLVATVPGLPGGPAVTSNTVTVTAPALTVTDNGNGSLGAGLHRNFTVSTYPDVAPAGGLSVTIAGFSGQVSTVPVTTINIPAGYSSANFEVDGLAAGTDSLTASATGWTSAVANYTVVDPTILFYYQPTTSITTAATSNSFSLYLNTPGCGQCDYANVNQAVNYTFASNTTGAPAPATGTFTAGSNYLAGAVGQATSAGTYQLTATVPGLPGATAPSATSSVVTVTAPALSVFDNGRGYLGAGLHRNFTVSLSPNVAGTGGLTVTIAGFSGTVSSVPTTTVVVPAGSSSQTFEVDGLAAGTDSLTVSATGWTSAVANYTVVDPTVLFYYQPALTITTATPTNSFSLYLNTPGCGQCDYANVNQAVNYTFASNTTGAPAPATGTFTAGTDYLSGAVGQATTTGSYALTATVPGLPGVSGPPSATSSTVTVNPPSLTVYDNGYGFLGAGLHRNFTVQLSDPAPSPNGLTVTLSSTSPTSAAPLLTNLTVAAAASSATFEVDGYAAGSTTITAAASGWTATGASITVVNPTFFLSGPSTSMLTTDTSNPFTVYTDTPGCGYGCDVANANITITPSITSASTPGIVPTPPQMTITAGTYYVSGSIGQPTTTGTFVLTITSGSLPGAPTTVNSPTITVS